MQTKYQTFVNLANELVIDGFSYVSAIISVAQLSPSLAKVIDGNSMSEKAHMVYTELKRRQPQAADRDPNAGGE